MNVHMLLIVQLLSIIITTAVNANKESTVTPLVNTTGISSKLQDSSNQSAPVVNSTESQTTANDTTTQVSTVSVKNATSQKTLTTRKEHDKPKRRKPVVGGVAFTFMMLGGMVVITLLVIGMAIMIELRAQKKERQRLAAVYEEGSSSSAAPLTPTEPDESPIGFAAPTAAFAIV